MSEIPKSEWKAPTKPKPTEIVGGAKYPACVACYKEGAECLWEFAVICVRMRHEVYPKRACEACSLVDRSCQLEWREEHPL